MATTTEQAKELAHARRLLTDERYSDALNTVERFLRNLPGPRERVEGLTIRLLGLMRVGRTAELTAALDDAFEANRVTPELSSTGELNALAAMVAHRLGSLDRCATHLVRSARALAAIDLTNAATAWAWHDLAMAYSETGFHGHALGAIDNARQVAASIGLQGTDFAAPGIRLRLATSLDHRGDTDGCQRVLRDIVADLDYREQIGALDAARPSSLSSYGYALARLAACDERSAVDETARHRARALMDQSADTTRGSCLRALGLVCLAIAERRPVEAVARLEAVTICDEALDAAEVYRLRALAHLTAGDHVSALRADRHAFRVASGQVERVRELFIEAVAGRLDSEELRRSVAGYTDSKHTDQLTGLPNRDHLDQHLSTLLTKGEAPLVCICDLDGFTAVNTEHGRSSGDLVLQRVAGILNRVMRRGDFVARMGGDEFAVVLPSVARPEVREIGRRIVAAVAEEDWDGLVPGARIGVTLGWVGVTDERLFSAAAEVLGAASAEIVRKRDRA